MMAIVGSEFEKMIWVDSDAFLLQNATNLIKQTKTGTLFWHDIWGVDQKNPIWTILNIEKPVVGFSQESGVVYIDKTKNWLPLYIAAYMNQHQRLFYSLLWGDKDTFFISFEALKMPYTFVPYAPQLIGKMGNEMVGDVLQTKKNKNKFYGYSFVQVDTNGRPAYVHFVSGKDLVLSYLNKNKTLFTMIRTWDPNGAHVDYNGIDPTKKSVDIEIDSGDFYGPLLDANDALGPFVTRLRESYEKAQQIIKTTSSQCIFGFVPCN